MLAAWSETGAPAPLVVATGALVSPVASRHRTLSCGPVAPSRGSMTPYQPVRTQQWTFRRVMSATLVVAVVVVGFWLLYRFHQAVFVLLIAIVIGTALSPLVAWLHRRGLTRTAAIMLVYFLLLALLVGFAVLIFPLVVEQGATIAAAVPDYYQSLRELMASYPSQLMERLGEFLPATLPGLAQTRAADAGPGGAGGGPVGILGHRPLSGNGHAAAGLSLDARWAAGDPILAAAHTRGQARGHGPTVRRHVIQDRRLYRRARACFAWSSASWPWWPIC